MYKSRYLIPSKEKPRRLLKKLREFNGQIPVTYLFSSKYQKMFMNKIHNNFFMSNKK